MCSRGATPSRPAVLPRANPFARRGATTWDHVATLARRTEAAGFSGMLFTEGHQVPWMNIAAASMAAPALHFSTGIAIAFARSPMISAEIAWELAQNTRGKFRLGLGSQFPRLR